MKQEPLNKTAADIPSSTSILAPIDICILIISALNHEYKDQRR
jgi:hypothetical protein